jgi:hypothetical protein
MRDQALNILEYILPSLQIQPRSFAGSAYAVIPSPDTSKSSTLTKMGFATFIKGENAEENLAG